MAVHEVKSWPDFFQPVQDGTKTFELRNDDRHYAVGDVIRLKEFDDRKAKFTGRSVDRLITYVLTTSGTGAIPPYHGLVRGYAILSLAPVK